MGKLTYAETEKVARIEDGFDDKAEAGSHDDRGKDVEDAVAGTDSVKENGIVNRKVGLKPTRNDII